MNENIENRYTNKSGRVIYHGYQEWYWKDKLTLRVTRKNNRNIGYEEYHGINITKYNIK